MKQLFSIVLLCVILLSSCGKEVSTRNISVDLSAGTFNVTPEEFISLWNTSIDNLKNSSDDEKTEYLYYLPEFSTSDEKMEVSEWIEVKYTSDATSGNLKTLELFWYEPKLSNTESLNMGFITSAIPSFINQDSTVDINKLINDVPSGTYVDETDLNANIIYSVVQADKYYSLLIEPMKLEK